MLEPEHEVAQRGIEGGADRMVRIGADVAEHRLDGGDDALIEEVVHDPGDPPRALRAHLLPDQLAVVVHRLGGEPHRLVQQLLVPVPGEDELQRLTKRRGAHGL